MKKLKAEAIVAKNKLKRASIRAKTAITTCMLATVCPAYCDINGNTAMQKFLKTMFSITVCCMSVKIKLHFFRSTNTSSCKAGYFI